jgi:hypothetical protein
VIHSVADNQQSGNNEIIGAQLFIKSYLPTQVHYRLMEDGNVLTTTEESKKTTLKDAGKGFILLGAVILLLTVLLFIMSIWENDYYGLFSRQTHLIFYLVLGLVLLGIGLVLVKSKPENAECQS